MGFFQKTGKFYVNSLAAVVAAPTIAGGARQINNQLSALHAHFKYPLCPGCGRGRMYPFGTLEGVDCSHMLGCNRCDHIQPAELGEQDAVALRKRVRTELAKDESIGRKFKIESRFFYGAAAGFLATAATTAYCDEWLSMTLATGLAAACATKGLSSAFRCWQIRQQRFFEPGLFLRWIDAGRWFV
jgi:hypothetical protein